MIPPLHTSPLKVPSNCGIKLLSKLQNSKYMEFTTFFLCLGYFNSLAFKPIPHKGSLRPIELAKYESALPFNQSVPLTLEG